jgi:hypothetical protein
MRNILAMLILGAVIFTGPAAFAGDNDRGYDPLGGNQAAVTTEVGQPSDPGAVTGPETPVPVWNYLRLDNMGK